MKKLVPALMVSTLALPVALAAVTFHGGDPTARRVDDQLCVIADASGLGNGDLLVTATATFTATVICENPAGNVAPGQTKTVRETIDFDPIPVDKNGRASVNECEDIPIPALACPNGSWTPIGTNISVVKSCVEMSQEGVLLFPPGGC